MTYKMEITKENYEQLKSKKLKRLEIAAIFNIPDWKLKKIISKEGWGKKAPKIKNSKAFSEETEESYYWAGFLAADGCISDKNDLTICINYDDIYVLEKFKEYMQSDHSIHINTNKYYRCSFTARIPENMAQILRVKFNITPRKSITYSLPDISDKNMFKHYLRGYFDGDGCICESFSNVNSVTASLYTTLVGSDTFIKDVYTTIYNILSISGSVSKRGKVSMLKYSTNSSKILLKFMYENSLVSLPRKYSLYQSIIIDNNRKTKRGELESLKI